MDHFMHEDGTKIRLNTVKPIEDQPHLVDARKLAFWLPQALNARKELRERLLKMAHGTFEINPSTKEGYIVPGSRALLDPSLIEIDVPKDDDGNFVKTPAHIFPAKVPYLDPITHEIKTRDSHITIKNYDDALVQYHRPNLSIYIVSPVDPTKKKLATEDEIREAIEVARHSAGGTKVNKILTSSDSELQEIMDEGGDVDTHEVLKKGAANTIEREIRALLDIDVNGEKIDDTLIPTKHPGLFSNNYWKHPNKAAFFGISRARQTVDRINQHFSKHTTGGPVREIFRLTGVSSLSELGSRGAQDIRNKNTDELVEKVWIGNARLKNLRKQAEKEIKRLSNKNNLSENQETRLRDYQTMFNLTDGHRLADIHDNMSGKKSKLFMMEASPSRIITDDRGTTHMEFRDPSFILDAEATLKSGFFAPSSITNIDPNEHAKFILDKLSSVMPSHFEDDYGVYHGIAGTGLVGDLTSLSDDIFYKHSETLPGFYEGDEPREVYIPRNLDADSHYTPLALLERAAYLEDNDREKEQLIEAYVTAHGQHIEAKSREEKIKIVSKMVDMWHTQIAPHLDGLAPSGGWEVSEAQKQIHDPDTFFGGYPYEMTTTPAASPPPPWVGLEASEAWRQGLVPGSTFDYEDEGYRVGEGRYKVTSYPMAAAWGKILKNLKITQ
jgi:hypothetical protein